MNVTNENPLVVFVNEYDGKRKYKLGLSKKNTEGAYEYGTIPVYFKVEPNIENKAKINLKNAWITFYKTEERSIPYVYVSDYEIVSGAKTAPENIFGREITLEEEDLPF